MSSFSIGLCSANNFLSLTDRLQEIVKPSLVVIRLVFVFIAHTTSELFQCENYVIVSNDTVVQIVEVQNGVASGHV